MSTDRARRTYDPSRKYRSVVAQQGRVTLEADPNEAEEIRAADARAALIDVIAPSGSPDDGFAISVPAPSNTAFDFAIAGGTLYVGGVRVETATTTYDGQKHGEWRDQPPPDAQRPTTAFSESVYLLLVEQEISAVEDEALREPALGGPDTAARTRIVQRVGRTIVNGGGCEQVFDQLLQATFPRYAFDAKTMRLTGRMQLKVDFAVQAGATDPCQPTAQSGFLGAENQLIRVKVANETQLVWGYDNASFLHRATVDTADRKKVTLAAAPVDVFHQPRALQVVEILEEAVALGDGAVAAQHTGTLRRIAPTGAYDPATRTIGLDNPVSGTATGIYVRVWENVHARPATATTPLTLTTPENVSTGVIVYASDGLCGIGDYWLVGVRPDQPRKVFPARLQAGFQDADGPRRWLVPLAVASWQPGGLTAAVTDCRKKFRNLVDLSDDPQGGGCCELLVEPGDDIQELVDRRLAENHKLGIAGLHVKLASGTYNLDRPLVFGKASPSQHITVSGCGMTTRLVARNYEVALYFLKWSTAAVYDLTVEGGSAVHGRGDFPRAQGHSYVHQLGAITFDQCYYVTVERVVAACAHGPSRGAACISAIAESGSVVAIRGCMFAPGIDQTGVLLINVHRAVVEDNIVAVNRAATTPYKSKLSLRKYLIDGVVIRGDNDPPTAAPPAGRTYGRAAIGNGLSVYFHAPSEVTSSWEAALHKLAAGTPVRGGVPRVLDRARAEKMVKRILGDAVDSANSGALGPAEKALFDLLIKNRLDAQQPAYYRAIVIGGTRGQDVRVANNSISDAMGGVHLALSRHKGLNEDERPPAISFERVAVVGNVVNHLVPDGTTGAHAGIFVGNVRHAIIRDNQVRGPDPTQGVERDRVGHGIRVWGTFGPQVLVTGNAVADAHEGIRVVSMPPRSNNPRLWLVTQNVVTNCDDPIFVSSQVTVAPDNAY
jgi:hypothetical protein